MDSQQGGEKSVKENKNKKDDKRSPVVLNWSWLKLLGSLAFLSGSQSLDIKGELHKDVLLPCMVVYKDTFNYNVVVLNWQRPENDTLVYTFFHGSSHPEYQENRYKGRTTIFYESLSKGNASLLLRNLTKSDAGNYICHVILEQSSGYLTQYVNLTVDDSPEAEAGSAYRIRIAAVMAFAMVVLVLLVVWYCNGMTKKDRRKDEEAKLFGTDTSELIMKYRKFMTSRIKHKDLFERKLIAVRGCTFATLQSHDVIFGDNQKMIDAKEMLTTENEPLISKRMLLVGDVGTGKSYFCKWLEEQWVQDAIKLFQCIIYVSGKKINKTNKETSVQEIVENKSKYLTQVLNTPNILLILDELDDLVYDANFTDTNTDTDCKNLGIDTSLQLNTLIKCIINKELLPETHVLIVTCRDSPINKLHKFCTSTFVLQESNETDVSNNVPADMYISYNPAFMLMMRNLNSFPYNVHNFTSPYEWLISILQQYLCKFNDEEGKIQQLANQSYENLVKGERNKKESTKQWDKFLKFFKCNMTKYQCEILRDMLAALHCVWQPNLEESLTNYLNFWLFGAHIGNKKACPLLSLVAEEHNTKYYHFIRFFMRLLPYPDYNSLRTKDPNMDDKIRQLLKDYFKVNFQSKLKDHIENYEKLIVLQCVFELHDDCVTKELSSIKHFCPVNTPLNSSDIRAIVYSFKYARLETLDLRLCALTDKHVEQLQNIIKNTEYVLLSSNRLTLNNGTFLEKLLKDPQCFIKKFALGTNDLGPHGAQALWRALEHNRILESLYVYHNNIEDDGTIGMVEHLLKNNTLNELHLCQNGFGEKAIRNIKILKAQKPKLKVVVTITEDLELFEYAEKNVKDLVDTWSNYNQEWLLKLLQAVQADLQIKDWDMDANLTQERVENLSNQLESIIDTIQEKSM